MTNLKSIGHTPTPWNYQNYPDGKLVIEANGIRIATLKFNHPLPKDQLDAAFIVKAANAHEELLEACKEVVKDFESAYQEVHKMTINKVKQAIVNAESNQCMKEDKQTT